MATKRKPKSRAPKGWKDAFLAELAHSSNVSLAARKAKVDSSTVYKARRSEPDFYRAWQEALAEGYDNLEMDLLRRLRIGEMTGGGPTKSRRKYDNAIAFRLLSAHREAVGRQRALRANEDEDAIIASINAKLEKMRQRQLAAEQELENDGVYRMDRHAGS
ncbi:hypothetical protein E3U23_08215 [Erythrobacter litoralis]|uniref:hypothetical protein n=1 Tax=Erythrobacter litoralis TaxID=39960 RepID=UPI0024348A15|nr:hypothetical protein [Erythrobacter litoralis]MDG6079176.1 hypothetical protein [Erythrobacter litoralis]